MGIAGSLNEKVRKGDVLIADYVRAYQYGRISETGKFKPRPQFQEPTDQAIRTNAAAFAQVTEWWSDLREQPDNGTGHPDVYFGGLASGDAVIENVESNYFAPILKDDPWLLAVDMESSGLMLAVRHLKESGYLTGLMVVRGISDIPAGVGGEGASVRKDGVNRESRKQWTEYASNAAASFLEQFIKNAFPCSPEVATPPPQLINAHTKKQIDAEVFASYHSHFVRADELPTIHLINDETYESSVLVPAATLEMWWRANPLTIRLISTDCGEVVGYWHILPLSAQAFRGLLEGRLTERQIGMADILTYQELEAGSVYVYITAVSVVGSMLARSASVILDLLAFLQLLHHTIGIDGISAQAVSDDPLNLMANFGMVRGDSQNAVQIWVLDTPEQIHCASQITLQRLKRMKGMVPEVSRDEYRSLVRLLQR
jgi:nucleoside phosphorylase